MKRNTPLITLLTGAALGVVLLVASMLQTPVKTPAGYSSTVTPSSASPASSAPAAPASSPAPSSASPTATPYAAAPAKATYAGKSNSGGATIAIVVYNGQVIAYVCNGSTIDAWFSGPASSDGKVTLTGKDNATLTAAYGVGQMTGDVTAHGTDFDFGVDTVSKSSALTVSNLTVLARACCAAGSAAKRRVCSVCASGASLTGSRGGWPPAGDARTTSTPASLNA